MSNRMVSLFSFLNCSERFSDPIWSAFPLTQFLYIYIYIYILSIFVIPCNRATYVFNFKLILETRVVLTIHVVLAIINTSVGEGFFCESSATR